MNRLDWARNEVNIAKTTKTVKRNKGLELSYDVALKMFETLHKFDFDTVDIELTMSILDKLIERVPLTQIEDTDDSWYHSRDERESGSVVYQNMRCASLFKTVKPDGTVEYLDVNRFRCIDYSDLQSHPFPFPIAEKIVLEHPDINKITMPYTPNQRYTIFIKTHNIFNNPTSECDCGVLKVDSVMKPDTTLIEIHRFFKQNEIGEFDEIEESEYDELVKTGG